MKKHILLVTNLFPSYHEPNRGVFIKQLVDRLSNEFDITVLCPHPWRPKVFRSNDINSRANNSNYPVMRVSHFVIPKVLRWTYGWFMMRALLPVIKNINAKKKVDLISAHWIYPDGYGAARVANELNIPISLHALGCDINEYTKSKRRRKLITEALMSADHVIVKSEDLLKKVADLTNHKVAVSTVMNGVDTDKFFPVPMSSARRELKLDLKKKYLIFIGNIQEEKGLIYLLEAIKSLSSFEAELLVIGSGPLKDKMNKFVSDQKLSPLVTFLGSVSHGDISKYLNAVNALCLPSLREGCPNIVLESLSCGTPVLASKVGAIPQIIKDKNQGMIIDSENSKTLANAIPLILDLKGEKSLEFDWMSWEDNASKIADIFNTIIGENEGVAQ